MVVVWQQPEDFICINAYASNSNRDSHTPSVDRSRRKLETATRHDNSAMIISWDEVLLGFGLGPMKSVSWPYSDSISDYSTLIASHPAISTLMNSLLFSCWKDCLIFTYQISWWSSLVIQITNEDSWIANKDHHDMIDERD